MGRSSARWALGFGAALTALLPSHPAEASGGYYSGNKGARAAGRAGAFTAKADDLSAVYVNPAGLARLGTTVIQVGNRFSYNAHRYTRQPTLDWGNLQGGQPPVVSFPTVKNDVPLQALEPLLGVGSNLGLDNWGFALLAYAPAGIAREEFPVTGGQRYMMVERESLVLDYSVSAAWKHREKLGLGATLQWIHLPRLKYSLVIDATPFRRPANPVTSPLDMRATVSGSDPFTLNAILGAWYRPVPFLEIGVAGQVIPSKFKTKSTLEVEPVSPTLQGGTLLQRNNTPANDVELTLPLPLTARVGLRYRHLAEDREVFDLELDVGYESWSRVDDMVLETNGIIANLQDPAYEGEQIPIGRVEIPKQWQDTLIVALGGDFAAIEELLTARAGVYYETPVAPPAYANVDFVSGKQLGAALGGSLYFGKLEVAAAYDYRHQLPLEVTEEEARVYQVVPGSTCVPPYTDTDLCHDAYVGQPSPAVNAGIYKAHSHAVSLDFVYRF